MNDNTDTEDFFGFGDSDVSDVDFFAVAEEENQDLEKTNPKPEDKSKVEEEQEEEEDDDLFGEAEQDQEEEEDEDDEDDSSKANPNDEEVLEGKSINTLSLLKEKGLVDYELEEGEVLTEEKASEILEDGLDNLFEDRIEELFEGTPDLLKEMNKFVLKGGNLDTFLNTIAKQNSTGITADIDLEKEENQILVVRKGLEEEGHDDEYITAQIDFLKDSKRLESIAGKHFKKWDDNRKVEQAAILKSQDEAKIREKNQRRELKTKVSTFLKETEEVGGFIVTPKDRKALPDYMSDRSVKLENGNQITSMQRDLMRVLNSPTGSVQIAKLLKNATETGELNFDEINKNTETKVTKQVRDNVRRSKQSIVKSAEGKNSRKKLKLADYFD